VPNLTIKETVRRAIAAESPDNVYLVRGILDNVRDLPRYAVIGDGDTPEDVILADIVLANVQQMPAWLPLFESDTFDMVLVDEGHHVPADTWQQILQKFPKAKRVYFTATPYRSDGRQIYGREVYRYPLAEAIAQGFVKNVVALDAVPEKLTFTLDGVEQALTLEQLLQMREQDWFSKSVALSEACNRSIVEKCVSALVEQCRTGTRHQIIAAACSIRHAEQVARLFEAAGVKATIVHSKLPWEERERRLDAFHAGRIACVVQVGLLGEGYDHPNISIAAIFRPYRSLAAYAQFIGRAMRAIPHAKPGDNVAYVITHKGLNLDRWWQDYKEQRREAAVLQAIADEEDLEDDSPPAAEIKEERPPGEPVLPLEARSKVLDEVISHYDVDSLLSIDAGVRAQAGRRVEPYEVDLLRRQIDDLRRRGLPIPDLDEMIESQQARYASASGYALNRTQVERRGLLLELRDRFRRSTAGVLAELRLDYKGRDLVPLVGKGDERSNYEVIIRLMQRTLNERLELPNREGRRNWSRDDLRAALRLIGDVRTVTLGAVRETLERPSPAVARPL
jgi:superfamily II DNA or RNA helicase